MRLSRRGKRGGQGGGDAYNQLADIASLNLPLNPSHHMSLWVHVVHFADVYVARKHGVVLFEYGHPGIRVFMGNHAEWHHEPTNLHARQNKTRQGRQAPTAVVGSHVLLLLWRLKTLAISGNAYDYYSNRYDLTTHAKACLPSLALRTGWQHCRLTAALLILSQDLVAAAELCAASERQHALPLSHPPPPNIPPPTSPPSLPSTVHQTLLPLSPPGLSSRPIKQAMSSATCILHPLPFPPWPLLPF